MCATSVIYDYGYQNPPWNNPDHGFTSPWPGAYPATPKPDREAADAIRRFLKLVEDAKEYDRATKQPDCEDPKKAEFMEQILERLDAIEKRLAMKPSATAEITSGEHATSKDLS